jgi:hypothetical protein
MEARRRSLSSDTAAPAARIIPTVPEPVSLRFDERRGDDMRRLVVIPLVQNAIGGLALAGPCWLALFLFGTAIDIAGQIALGIGFCAFCGVTALRFFADDIGLLASMYNAGYRAATAEGNDEIDRLRGLLEDEQEGRASDAALAEQRIAQAQRPIVVNRAGRDSFVRPQGGAEVEDAQALLLQTEDGGYLPGRDVTGLSAAAQAAAVAVLHATGLTVLAGNRTRITASKAEVYRALARLVEADKHTSPE